MGIPLAGGDGRDIGAWPSPSSEESSSQLRRLRFADRETERAFREFHLERAVPTYRGLFIFILAFQVVLLATGPLVDDLELSDPRLWTRTAFGVAQALLGLWAIRQPSFRRWGEAYMLGQVVVIGLMLAVLFAPHPLGFARMMGYLISTVILARLRVRHAVIGLAVEIVAFAVLASRSIDDPLPPRIVALCIVGLLLTVAAYMLEHSERRDFLLTHLLLAERAKAERLLLNVLPPSVARTLIEDPEAQVAEGYDEVTVVFADIPEFTPNAARFGPRATVRLLSDVYSCFDRLAVAHGLEKIKTVGDAYMAVAGAPERRPDHAAIAVDMALDMMEAVRAFRWPGDEPLTLRIGLASGPAVAGVIGTSKFSYDLWGDTVNVASRLSGVGEPGTLVMTEHTYALVEGPRVVGTPRTVVVKGKGRMAVFVVVPRLEPVKAARSPRSAAPRRRAAAKA